MQKPFEEASFALEVGQLSDIGVSPLTASLPLAGAC